MDPNDYLDWRERFGGVWRKDSAFMALLPLQEQWDMHAYFEFHESKTDEEALAWQATVLANEPEMEELAIDAAIELQDQLDRAVDLANQDRLPLKPPGVVVRVVGRPEPNIKLLAQALIQHARDQAGR